MSEYTEIEQSFLVHDSTWADGSEALLELYFRQPG